MYFPCVCHAISQEIRLASPQSVEGLVIWQTGVTGCASGSWDVSFSRKLWRVLPLQFCKGSNTVAIPSEVHIHDVDKEHTHTAGYSAFIKKRRLQWFDTFQGSLFRKKKCQLSVLGLTGECIKLKLWNIYVTSKYVKKIMFVCLARPANGLHTIR